MCNLSRPSFHTAAGILLVIGTALAVSQEKTPWKIAGELEEACSCDAACPCWWDSKPTKMTCGGGETVFIERGNYGDISLDGLAFAFIGQSPAGKSMMESFGNWNFANIYVHESANLQQRKALEDIARTIGGPAAPNDKMKVRYVPISRKIQGKEHEITLGVYGSYSGHLLDGGLGGESKIVNPAGADPLRKEYHQGRTLKYVYNDAGQKWSWSHSNYMWNKFEVTSEDYEKFAAGLAQKMPGMKKK